jgi:cytochrome P450 family 130
MKNQAADSKGHLDFSIENAEPLSERLECFENLRQTCPVARGATGQNGVPFWSLMRYQDIVEAAKQPDIYSNGHRVRLELRRPPLESDPPEHTQIRKMLTPFFSMNSVLALDETLRSISKKLLEPLISDGEGDVNELLARPLPTQIVLYLLGQPLEDWRKIKEWSENSRPQNMVDVVGQKKFKEADKALWDYSRKLVYQRGSKLKDSNTDMLSGLLTGTVDDDPLSEDLVVGIVRLLLAAGHDSTSQSIGLCVAYLARDIEAQDLLRREPERLPAAIEEILRMETPVVAMPRIVTKDIELDGKKLVAGDRLMLNYTSANRDSEIFDQADEYVLDRSPNKHLVFGSGIHTCIGANLARQEIRVALEELLKQTRHFTLSAKPELQNMIHYGYETIPLRIESLEQPE